MANGGLVGALRVTLGIDTAAFEAGSKRAAATAKRDAGLIERAYSGAGGAVKTAMAGLAAGISLGALAAVAKQALDYASGLAEVAQQLGVTTKDLQAYRYAATQVGISQEEMDKGLAKLTVSMGQAREGVEKPKAAFKELSDLLGKDVLKSASTAGEAIPLIAEALKNVEDPARRAAIEVALFGKTGQKLDTLLSGGAGGVNELTQAAEDLGLVLSEDQIANADKTADKIAEVKQILEASIAKAVSENSDAIYRLAESLEVLISKIPTAINEMGKFFDYVQRGWGRLQVGLGAMSGNTAMLESGGKNITNSTSDLARRANYGKPMIGAAGNDALAKQAAAIEARKNAGAGTSDSARASAAAKAKAAAEKAARAAEKAQRDREKQTERYNNDMASLQRDQFSAESDMSNSIEEQAEFARKRVELDAKAYADDLASQVKLGDLTAVQAKRLQLGKNYNTQLELDLINQKRDDDLTRQGLDTTDARLTLRSDLLRGELNEARSQSARRVLQEKLLDIEYDRQKAALEAVLALNSSTQAEKDIAQARLDQLGELKRQDAESVRRDTAGPMEAFGDSLHKTAAQIKEDFEQIQVDGIQSLNDGLVDAIVNSKSLGDVFSNVAKQMIADIIKIGLQQVTSGIFGGKSSGSGGGITGILTGIASALGGKSMAAKNAASFSLPGFAKGGTLQVKGNTGIDTNLMSINGQPAARVNRGENIKIVPTNDNAPKEGTTIHQTISFAGGVDLATRTEVYRVADAARAAAVQGVSDANRRRG